MFQAVAFILAASPLLFGEARAPLPVEADSTAQQCGVCHAEALEKWQHSMHALATSNELYVVSHRREPMKWCDDCHAPNRLGEQGKAEGVSCAACHVRAGVVLTAHAPTRKGQECHPMREEPALAGNQVCAECHQFNFPAGRADPVRYGPWPMQNTAEESKGAACGSCHDAHSPNGAHDVEALRKAIVATASRDGDAVKVRVSTVGVSHHLPTGDPNRRIRVELCSDESCLGAVASRELERRAQVSGDSWRISSDTTVGPSGLTLTFPGVPEVQWVRLSYRYAARSNENALAPEQVEAWLNTIPIKPEVGAVGGAR
ncbi:MAG: hypothetical protein QM723_17100 [Myxococcaceae bacterium]